MVVRKSITRRLILQCDMKNVAKLKYNTDKDITIFIFISSNISFIDDDLVST